MKRFFKNIFIVVFLAGVFAGCKINLENGAQTTPKATVTLQIGGAKDSRTAKPVGVDFSSYYYQLTSVNSSSTIKNHFDSRKEYDELSSVNIELPLDTYTFVLSAYSTGSVETPLFTGTVSDVNLTADGIQKNLEFFMLPAAGNKGNLEIKFELLNSDPAIEKVYAGIATTPTVTRADCDITSAGLQAISGSGTNRYVEFSCSGLDTGKTMFAIFYALDANNNPVATIAESVIVAPGMTSSSTISRNSYRIYSYPVTIQLNKNGVKWGDVRKVKLVDKNSENTTEYNLVKTGNEVEGYTFSANVWNSDYEVWVQTNESNVFKNTYNSVNTSIGERSKVLEFFTATMTPGNGIVFTPIDRIPQADGTILLLKGADFSFTASIKDGYDLYGVTGSAITIKNGSTALSNKLTSVGSSVTNKIQNVNSALTITCNNASPISYSITYDISAKVDNGVKQVSPAWVGGSVPSSLSRYTVQSDFGLPTAANITCEGMIIDGWYVADEGIDSAFSTIRADTRHENLTLLPKWKKAEASKGESSSGEESEGSLSSNGISFIIIGSGTETNIYYDLNSNGEIDSGETKVTIGGVSDFTNYEITAESLSGDIAIASNVTFTMKGGQIYSIKGLGKDAANTSTLNISGSAKIGGIKSSTIVDEKQYATGVHGVVLNSFTNEIVNVTGKIDSPQNSIVMLTDYEYDAVNAHYVATMNNKDFAEAGLFNVYNSTAEANGLPMKKIGKIENDGNFVIRLANEESIILPVDDPNSDDSIVVVKNDEKTAIIGFTFGEDKINTQCSALSISVDKSKGSFKLQQSKIYPNDSSKETGLSYLGQKPDMTYDDGILYEDKEYVYMHVMASNNQFTEGDASEFVSKVLFIPKKKSDGTFEELSVKINIETVSYEKIQEMKNQAKTNMGSENAFSYFDGSFYLGVNKNAYITWSGAYNEAKKTKFNGLKGYLMNITSEIENSYIVNKMTVGNGWIGGARILPGSGYDTGITAYDMDEIPALQNQTYVTGYYWVAGPESGTMFTDGNIPSDLNNNITYNGQGYYGYEGVKVTKVERSGTKNNYTYTTTTKITTGCGYSGTTTTTTTTSPNGTTGTKTEAYGSRTVSEIGYTNWDNNEPNDSCGGKSEQCVHFYSSSGKWNDYADSYNDPKVYIVEFTPYTRYASDGQTVLSTSGTPDAAPIKKTPNFNLNNYN